MSSMSSYSTASPQLERKHRSMCVRARHGGVHRRATEAGALVWLCGHDGESL